MIDVLNRVFRNGFRLVAGLLIAVLLVGCGSTRTTAPGSLAEEIPYEANRVIMVQQPTQPSEMYVQTISYLRRQNFEVTPSVKPSNEEALFDVLSGGDALTLVAEAQVTESMAIQYNIEFERAPAGGTLVASIEYAEAIAAPSENWKQAAWDSGRQQEAFYRAVRNLRGIAYDKLDFAQGEAIDARHTS